MPGHIYIIALFWERQLARLTELWKDFETPTCVYVVVNYSTVGWWVYYWLAAWVDDSQNDLGGLRMQRMQIICLGSGQLSQEPTKETYLLRPQPETLKNKRQVVFGSFENCPKKSRTANESARRE